MTAFDAQAARERADTMTATFYKVLDGSRSCHGGTGEWRKGPTVSSRSRAGKAQKASSAQWGLPGESTRDRSDLGLRILAVACCLFGVLALHPFATYLLLIAGFGVAPVVALFHLAFSRYGDDLELDGESV